MQKSGKFQEGVIIKLTGNLGGKLQNKMISSTEGGTFFLEKFNVSLVAYYAFYKRYLKNVFFLISKKV